MAKRTKRQSIDRVTVKERFVAPAVWGLSWQIRSPPQKLLAVPFQFIAEAGCKHRKVQTQSELPIAAKVAETVSSVVLRRSSNNKTSAGATATTAICQDRLWADRKKLERQRQILCGYLGRRTDGKSDAAAVPPPSACRSPPHPLPSPA